MFYLVTKTLNQRSRIIEALNQHEILAVFHYLSLHKSHYYKNKYSGKELIYADRYSDCLIRLPLYYELAKNEINSICEVIKQSL